MTRPVVFFIGLFATIALTVVAGEWLVPDDQVDPVFGLEVTPTPTEPVEGGDGGSSPATPTLGPTATPTLVATPSGNGPELRPTLNWVNVFSQQTEVGGEPAPVGSVVAAHDPDGTLAGRFTVVQEGIFGLMAVYADDPLTPIDEGAEIDDELTFTIDGSLAEVLGPDVPIWTGNGGLLQLNLSAASNDT